MKFILWLECCVLKIKVKYQPNFDWPCQNLWKHPRIDSFKVLSKYSKSLTVCTENSRTCDTSCVAGNCGGENTDATRVKSTNPMHANGQAAYATEISRPGG